MKAEIDLADLAARILKSTRIKGHEKAWLLDLMKNRQLENNCRNCHFNDGGCALAPRHATDCVLNGFKHWKRKTSIF
jgi:hypothetical protein